MNSVSNGGYRDRLWDIRRTGRSYPVRRRINETGNIPACVAFPVMIAGGIRPAGDVRI